MIKKTATAIVLTLTLSSILFTSGCIVAAIGAAGGVFYAKGAMESTLNNTPTEIAAATEKAFKELKITKLSAASSDLEAEITGRSTTDKKITVISKTTGDNISSISIRIGTFGDKDMSETIFQKIKSNL
jgi:hypothetical protein